MSGNLSLRYPVILVHGIAARDRGAIISFWGRVPEILEAQGAVVFLGNTDSWGSYESNAALLHTTIEKVLRETNTEKVNIIAHSKGGIDSRYCIWKYNCAVASLTTIATPHHGSEIADLLYRQKLVHTGITRRTLRVFGKLYGDIHPDIYNLNYQLTTEQMKKFNENIPMDKKVYCQSMYTTMRNAWDDVMFFYSYRYLRGVAGENDGFVSARSVQWGDATVRIGSGISHAEITDFKKRTISGIEIPAMYIHIVSGLGEMGF